MRFRKSIKIAPGLKINLSKSGISTTVGGKGFSMNAGSRGTHLNVGIPGTGVSGRYKLDGGAKPGRNNAADADFDPAAIPDPSRPVPGVDSPRSKVTAYLLWLFLGILGGHKFYLKKSGMGFLYLITLGLMGIGWLYDLFTLGRQVDAFNQALSESPPAVKPDLTPPLGKRHEMDIDPQRLDYIAENLVNKNGEAVKILPEKHKEAFDKARDLYQKCAELEEKEQEADNDDKAVKLGNRLMALYDKKEKFDFYRFEPTGDLPPEVEAIDGNLYIKAWADKIKKKFTGTAYEKYSDCFIKVDFDDIDFGD